MTPDISKKIRIRVGSGPAIYLNPSEYVTSGGEGAIYLKKNEVFKVYTGDEDRAYLEEKVGLLQAFLPYDSTIVCPREILYDDAGRVMGYTMPYVKGEPLVRFFTNDYRMKNGYDELKTIRTVEVMRNIVRAAHMHHAVMVDANEMNYLMVSGHKPVVIDVDSWQIGRFKATVIMPSIRDHHTKDFCADSDWFSWAVVTFQLFTGIHPYKGRHPKYKPFDFLQRMKDNVSVFNPDTHLPASARDFGLIPKGLKDWYVEVFENKARLAPPDNFDSILPTKVIHRTMIQSSGSLRMDKLRDYTVPIRNVFHNGIVQLMNGAVMRGQKLVLMLSQVDGVKSVDDDVALAAQAGNGPLLYHIGPGNLATAVPCPLTSERILCKDNRIFLVHAGGITELARIGKMGSKFVVSPGSMWSFNPLSTTFGEGAAVYDALGRPFVVMPIGDAGCVIQKCPELEGKVPIEVKGVKGFFCCLAKDRHGQNHKVEVMYDEATGEVIRSWTGPTDENELNFAMNSRGIVVAIIEDGKLIAFSPKDGRTISIDNPNISTDMKLYGMNGDIVFTRHNELWQLSMK